MRPSARFLVLIFALGCQGELFDYPLPGNPPGSGPPPTPYTPALAIRVGGPGLDKVGGMATDPAGGVFLAGTFTGTADFDPSVGIKAINSLGGSDGFLARYSAGGAVAWARGLGGTRDEQITALIRDAAGNLYVAGGFEGDATFGLPGSPVVLNSAGGADGFVAKYSSDGQLLWARRFGGTGLDQLSALAIDATGTAIYAGGTFNGLANAQPAGGVTVQSNGESDGFVLALTSDGSLRWILPIGGTQADAVAGVAVESSGRVVVAGTFRGSADFSRNGGIPTSLPSMGGADFFLAAYSSTSALERARAIGGLNDEAVVAGGLVMIPVDRPLVLGTFTGSVDFDPGPGTAVHTSQGIPGSGQDVFLAGFDPNGGFLSVAGFGGSGGSLTASRPLVATDGGVFLTGSFSGSIDFDPGSGESILTSFGRQSVTDAFVIRLNPAGGLLWADQFGQSTSVAGVITSGSALALAPEGSIVVAGSFFGSPDFDPGATAFRLSSVGTADGFVIKLTSAGAIAP